MEASKKMQKYFETLKKDVDSIYEIATKARQKGLDPVNSVEVKLASNMAERVVGLVSVMAPQIVGTGIVNRIVELEKKYGSLDWRVAMIIALEIAQEKFCKFKDEVEAIEIGIRIGFAYQTVGVVSSPLEGFTNLELKDRRDNKGKYFCLNFSGPIRNAGGTAASTCILIADYIRKKLGYAVYDPDEKEINRCNTEVVDYHERVTNLQYFPSKEESDFMVLNCPIEISGEPTEKFEVSNYKDLPRVPTNKIRSGFCLLHSSCLPLKAQKLWKKIDQWGKEMDMEHWSFLKEFIDIKNRVHASHPGSEKKENKKDNENKDIYEKNGIIPNNTFVSDLVAGRPVFGYPMKEGGFRLRYGRSRTSGFSAQSINPASMHVMLDFIASATQCKTERPGKAAAFSVCDTIEGPTVVLTNGDVVQINTDEEGRKYKKDIKSILFLGDILQNYGDYINRAHRLIKPGYCEEWWVKELKKILEEKYQTKNYDLIYEKFVKDLNCSTIDATKAKLLIEKFLWQKPTIYEAFLITEKFSVALHPKYTYHYKLISKEDFIYLLDSFKNSKFEYENEKLEKIIFEKNERLKAILENIGLPHKYVQNEFVVINEVQAVSLTKLLGIKTIDDINSVLKKIQNSKLTDINDIINEISNYKIRDKTGIFIGSRMGRPEKAKMRKMNGSPHVLFPVGEQGGRLKSFQTAMDANYIESNFLIYHCDECDIDLPTSECIKCGKIVKQKVYCDICNKLYDEKCSQHGEATVSRRFSKIPIKDHMNYYKKKLNENMLPDLIKGLKGIMSAKGNCENLFKGVLRAKHSIFVNKDGTIRYDCSEVPITHFKPKEIAASIEKLKKLGYDVDIYGEPLINDSQILEIKPQDIVIPACPDSPDEGSDAVFIRATQYIDELLEKQYNLSPFYNVKKKEDLIGQLVIGLAPHTSAGSLCRIIGFSKMQAFLAHPLMHAAMRRDCDGDESCFLLLMDAFLNFSREYLPASRGSTMDAPLVLTSILNPAEVDDMAFDMDVAWEYPLEFYEACCEFKNPWDVKIETLGNFIGTERQFEKMGFTHDTTNFNQGVLCSSYKILPTMKDKLDGQMLLAEKIRAVKESDVATLVINKHFLKDIKGNLRKFSQQEVRCLECNTKYRRVPLSQRCSACGSYKLTFTIAEGSVVKYLEPSILLMNKYNIAPYEKQTLEILKERVESVFGKDPEKQTGLGDFFK